MREVTGEKMYFGRVQVIPEGQIAEGAAELYLIPGCEPHILLHPDDHDKLRKKEVYFEKPRKGARALHDARSLCLMLGLTLKVHSRY